jgi:hypothetical protein
LQLDRHRIPHAQRVHVGQRAGHAVHAPRPVRVVLGVLRLRTKSAVDRLLAPTRNAVN